MTEPEKHYSVVPDRDGYRIDGVIRNLGDCFTIQQLHTIATLLNRAYDEGSKNRALRIQKELGL